MRIPFAVGRMKDRFAEIVVMDADPSSTKLRWSATVPASATRLPLPSPRPN